MDATVITDIFGEYSPIIPMVTLIIGALIMPALYFGFKKKAPVSAIALIVMIISIAINLIMLLGDNYPSEYATYANLFTYNDFSGLMILLFQIVALIVLFVSVSSKETTTLHFGAYNALLLIATSGMMFVACADDLVAIFVGVETVSIPSYALVAMKRNDARAAEAAVKYVIIGGMSTALTVYGISMIYGALGTLSISEMGAALGDAGYSWAFVIGFICMLAGYGFKIAAVPFHMWAPDVYEGASTPVSIFLATGSKKMGLVVFFKIFLVMFVFANAAAGLEIEEIQYIFAIIAAFSMTVGNVVAISQSNIKRMLAYSSIAQAGYILIAMAVMSEYALTGGLFHMFTHVFMKGGAFLVEALLTFVFAAYTMSAVQNSAQSIVVEVRRQFREIKGIMEGTAKPDYASCVAICTKGALREMVVPALLAIIVPIVTGLILGCEGVVGLLGGVSVTGFAMAVFMSNAGGAWDNAKKYIEKGNFGGKGSENHKAAVVGDTVGDPFKDTSGPSLNILIKLCSTISIVFSGLIVAFNLTGMFMH